ncbi:MAG TPA: response regulator [Burkholderiales bacterium]|jgi:two-component system response regulator TtrR
MSQLPPPTAYVVDDDESVRALWQWLMESNGIAVRTFASASAFIDAYRGGPGCLVLDVAMPGMSGLELQDHLKRQAIEIPILFVSGQGDIPTAVSAIKGGAVDFIQKPFDYRQALATVRSALERDAQARAQRAKQAGVAERLASLTSRESEVLRRVVDGKPNKLIAEELEISVRTVEFHRANAMEKLGAPSPAMLAQMMALRAGRPVQ